MRRNLGRRLAVAGVHLELAFGVGDAFDGAAGDAAVGHHHGAHGLAELGVLADHFGDDVARAFERLFGRHAELRGDFGERRGVALFPEELGERFEALVARDGGLGAALRFVGQVEIFEFGLFEGGFDLRLELRGELALFLNGGEDGFAAVFEFAEILELFLDVADLDFVQVAGDFLAIARNEGHGGAAVEEFDDGIHAFERDVQQLRDMYEYGGGECLQFSHDSQVRTFMIPQASFRVIGVGLW